MLSRGGGPSGGSAGRRDGARGGLETKRALGELPTGSIRPKPTPVGHGKFQEQIANSTLLFFAEGFECFG